MTKQEALEKIKKLLFSEVKEFANAKLVDGTIIQWDGELKEGTAINVVDMDGNIMPAPDATHELEDGTLVTTVGGLVTKIEQSTPEASEVESDVAGEMHKMFAEFAEQFNAFKVEFSAIKEKITSYDEKFSALESSKIEVDEKFNTIKEVIESIAEQPAAEIEEPKEAKFKKNKKQSAADKLAAYLKTRN